MRKHTLAPLPARGSLGSAANLDIHLHCMVLGGVYQCGPDGAPTFVEVNASTDDELHALMQAISTRLTKLLTRRRVLVLDNPAAAWRGLLAGIAGLFLMGATPAQTVSRVAYSHSIPGEAASLGADFGPAALAPDARHLADSIARARDNQGKGFFLIDKVHATLYVFDRNAHLQASTPVLLGAAIGDDSVPGIGARPMAQILPVERTTPAGRFVAEVGRNLQGEDVVWVDHGAAVSMHRVRTSNPLERRAERLGTASVADNRISYGCINVPVAFYDQHVRTVFTASRTAVVYVLPETRSLQDQFGRHLVPARANRSLVDRTTR